MSAANSKARPQLRPTLFDYIDRAESESNTNKYCQKSDLRDEASVESFFVSRLLKDLGYADSEIRLKESLAEIVVPRGRRKELYKPDYVVMASDTPRWLIDAKTPEEKVDDWAYQGAGYALGLNRRFSNDNPCRYYVITNGFEFNVYKWDETPPTLSLNFPDFVDDSPKFLELQSLLGADNVRKGWAPSIKPKQDMVTLERPSVEQVKRIFSACHKLIWKTEKMNPQPAFFEFVKIMFVKLWEDRKIHDDPILGDAIRNHQAIPKDRIVFSEKWIETLEQSGVENPIDTVLFEKLSKTLREAVAHGKKKPVFGDDEGININSGTIKAVVSKLEPYDMFSIDEDLNGRLYQLAVNIEQIWCILGASALFRRSDVLRPASHHRICRRSQTPFAPRSASTQAPTPPPAVPDCLPAGPLSLPACSRAWHCPQHRYFLAV